MRAENAVILVIHRNQSDPANEDPILEVATHQNPFLSGLHLGQHNQALHMLQLSAYGGINEIPELLANSEVNGQNRDLLFKLLQEVLPVSTSL